MTVSRKYLCTKCKAEYEKDEIRITAENKTMCVYCLGKKVRPVKEIKKEKKGIQEEFVEYQCENCNYSFKRKKSFLVLSCPYCEKKNKLVLKKSKSASSLLDESADKKYDY